MTENILPVLEKYKLSAAVIFVGLVLILGGVFAAGLKKETAVYPKESLVQTQKLISVDVAGAVLNPGVYQLPESARVEDAVNAAGGFAEQASGEYISKYLNLAQKLVDGSKIYIPKTGEQLSGSQMGSVAGTATPSKVNINSSTQSELEALSGIGPVTASKIISDRPYQSVDELVSKKVVSKAVFEKIKEQLVVY